MEILICCGYAVTASFKLCFRDDFYFSLFQVLPCIPYKEALIHIFLCLPHQRFLLIPIPFPAAGKKVATSQLPILQFLYWKKRSRQGWKQKQRGCLHSPVAQCSSVYTVPLCSRCPAPHDSPCLLTDIIRPDGSVRYIRQ